MKQTELEEQLETMIDSNGLTGVFMALHTIMNEKAVHMRENWQAEYMAKNFENAADIINVCHTKIADLLG